MTQGSNHITLAVVAIAQSFECAQTIPGVRPVAQWRNGASLFAGDRWLALVGDNHVHQEPLPEYIHTPIWQAHGTEGELLSFLDPNGHQRAIHASDVSARREAARAEPWEGWQRYDL